MSFAGGNDLNDANLRHFCIYIPRRVRRIQRTSGARGQKPSDVGIMGVLLKVVLLGPMPNLQI